MKKTLTLFLCFLLASPVFAAINNGVVWEVQSGGSSSNGGGFDSTVPSPGTDETGTAQAYTDIVTSASATGLATATYTSGITATGSTGQVCILTGFNNSLAGAEAYVALTSTNTIAGSTVITIVRAGSGATSAPTSATAGNGTATCSGTATISTTLGVTEASSAAHAFTSTTHGPGNIIDITGGTNCVNGRFEIISQSSGTVTLDHAIQTASVGTPATCSGNLGGPLDTFSTAFSAMTFGNTVYVKGNGSFYSVSVGVSWTTACQNNPLPTIHAFGPCTIIGYDSTHTDGCPSKDCEIVASTSIATIWADSGAFHTVKYIQCDGAGKTTTACFNLSGNPLNYTNLVVKGWTTKAFTLASGDNVYYSEITGGASGCTAAINTQGTDIVAFNDFHANQCPQIQVSTTSGAIIERNLIHDNTSGASTDGIQIAVAAVASRPLLIRGNVIYNNNRDGIRSIVTNGFDSTLILNNIIQKNAGVGINNTLGLNYGATSFTTSDYNVFWNNGGDTGATVTHNLTGFVNGPHDVCAAGCGGTISGDPFTNAAGAVFALNATSGQGAAARAAGAPTNWGPTNTTVGYPDIGAAQHQDSGGGSTQYSFGVSQ